MTRNEARRIISIWLEWLEESKDLDGQRGYIEGHFNEEDVEAFRMAIKALSQPIVCKNYCIDDDNIYCSPKVAEMVVEALSAARNGHWIYGEHEVAMCDGYICDQCGFFITWDYNHKSPYFIEEYHFCPSCGADMRGEEE